MSVLADCLKAISNAEKAGKRQVLIRPSSKVIVKFLEVMQKNGYIGEFEVGLTDVRRPLRRRPSVTRVPCCAFRSLMTTALARLWLS